ncbi:MAG: TauD/TfdA family dioxygenase [Alphaproteobacteria bacterium]|nr:TauD/TfdA family dioxygenase [Alphaproteobacteria bacterium]
MEIESRPLSDALGAELFDVDLARPMDETTFRTIHGAFLEHSLILFRDQHITPEQHIAFSRRFGGLATHVFDQFLLPEHPEILRVSNKREKGELIGLADAGKYWHSDLAYMKRPSLGSILHALQVPPTGGDTLFANMTRAYDTLPQAAKGRLGGMMAVNRVAEGRRTSVDGRIRMSKAQLTKTPDVVHPVIRTHPETGCKSLYVSQSHTDRIVGMDLEEGRALIRKLVAHATRPENIYTHKWRPYDILMWDNRCTMHRVAPYDRRHRRHMHRTTIKGDTPY